MSHQIKYIKPITYIALAFIIACSPIDNTVVPKTETTHLDSIQIQAKLNQLDQKDYFPLQSGNHWEFPTGYSKWIENTYTINNTSYFYYYQLTHYYGKYYRKTSDGKVYERDSVTSDGHEFLKYDLGANVNQTWNYTVVFGGYTDTYIAKLLSKSDTVKIGNYTFTNCYKYYFDCPELTDDEATIWLAPGVGFVKEQYDSPPSRLSKVKINGVEIVF